MVTYKKVMQLKRRNGVVAGVSSRVGSRHIIMLDYDCKTREYVRRKIKTLIRVFMLPACYIFRSSLKSYHVVCFKLVRKGYLKRIFRKSETDKLHQLYPDRVGYGTLRISKKKRMKSSKIKFVEQIQGVGKEREDLRDQYFMLVGFENGA